MEGVRSREDEVVASGPESAEADEEEKVRIGLRSLSLQTL
jgi:hypothetical protein